MLTIRDIWNFMVSTVLLILIGAAKIDSYQVLEEFFCNTQIKKKQKGKGLK